MDGETDLSEYFLAGGFGGVLSVVVGHPLDTIKVRLQTTPIYSGTLDCLRKTVRAEGVRGLYKGMAPPLAGVAPIFAVSFMGYGVGRKIFGPGEKSQQLSALQDFAAGAFSGVFTTALMAPGERVKCLLQVQQAFGARAYCGPIDCLKKLYVLGGVRSIYRGTGATLFRDVPASGLYFLTYERMKRLMTRGGKDEGGFAVTVLAGGATGISYWLVGMPADVLKSRLQTAPREKYPNGMRDVFRDMMLKEGPLSLYRGFVPVILRAFPANAACFMGFEAAKNAIAHLKMLLLNIG